MDFRNISEQAEHYVRSYFDEHPNDTLLYHNLYHTERVVKAAKQIGQHYQLNDTDFFIIRVASWFHDIGYLKGVYHMKDDGTLATQQNEIAYQVKQTLLGR